MLLVTTYNWINMLTSIMHVQLVFSITFLVNKMQKIKTVIDVDLNDSTLDSFPSYKNTKESYPKYECS